MATFTKLKLSESTNGRGIEINDNATPGQLIHTAVSGTTSYDEVWLYATNTSTSAVKLTIEFGGDGDGDIIELYVPNENGLVTVIPGFILNNGSEVKAYAGSVGYINIFGFVNRIS